MPEEPTSLFKRAADSVTTPGARKSAAIGGLSGGVSAATLVLVYQLFVTQSNFNAYKQEAKESQSRVWRTIMDLTVEVEVLKATSVRSIVRTNL
jgi:hypothetical protein